MQTAVFKPVIFSYNFYYVKWRTGVLKQKTPGYYCVIRGKIVVYGKRLPSMANMGYEDFIVLKAFHGNSPLDRSNAWSLIAHKKPDWYSHHSVSDEAIDRLLEKKFLEVHWTDHAGNTEWKISGIGLDAYREENKLRKKESKNIGRKIWRENNWVLAEVIKYCIAGVIGGIIGALFAILAIPQLYHQSKQKPPTEEKADSSKFQPR